MSIDYDRLRDVFMQVDVPFPWRVDARPSKHHPEVTKFQVVGLDDSVVVEMETEGEYAEVVERDLNLIVLAPDMARELLRLRRELRDLRDLMWKHSAYLKADGHRTAGDWTENHADRLARILEGDEA